MHESLFGANPCQEKKLPVEDLQANTLTDASVGTFIGSKLSQSVGSIGTHTLPAFTEAASSPTFQSALCFASGAELPAEDDLFVQVRSVVSSCAHLELKLEPVQSE